VTLGVLQVDNYMSEKSEKETGDKEKGVVPGQSSFS
jgi:hypothetical protein